MRVFAFALNRPVSTAIVDTRMVNSIVGLIMVMLIGSDWFVGGGVSVSCGGVSVISMVLFDSHLAIVRASTSTIVCRSI